MKKILFILLFLGQGIYAQTVDYRTSEDGINKLLSNTDFVQDVLKLGTSENFTLEDFNNYMTKYVPEYSNFKIDGTKLDFNKIYYANIEGNSTDALVDLFGKSLNMKSGDIQTMKNAFNGQLKYSPNSSYSTGLSHQLYERGKDAKVDLAVDYSVDFFQSKLGDGGLNSALIDIGGGLLGGLFNALNERYDQKMAELEKNKKNNSDLTAYITGTINLEKYKQSDLANHGKALIFSSIKVDYDLAIQHLNEAINEYKKNPERSCYLYLAYMDRAFCKMQKGAYRAAIIDYYFAQKIIELVENKKLPNIYYPTHTKDTPMVSLISPYEIFSVHIKRAYAKYRLGDFKGSINDINSFFDIQIKKPQLTTNQPNDFKDFAYALKAMNYYSLNYTKEAYETINKANIDGSALNDTNNDGIIDFIDKAGTNNIFLMYHKFPLYFIFDIEQIRGLISYSNGDINKAIEVYEKILSTETNIVNNKENNYSNSFTKSGGDISTVFSTLSSFYFNKNQKEKALNYIDQALMLNPDVKEYKLKKDNYTKSSIKNRDTKNNPEITKKTPSEFQYKTLYEKLSLENNNIELFKTIKNSITSYPKENLFFAWAFKYFENNNNPNNIDEIANLYTESSKKNYHLLKALKYSFMNDIQNEKDEIIKSFESGNGFYEMNIKLIYPEQNFKLINKKYYCTLINKFLSKTNNNFIPLTFNKEEKTKELDSIKKSNENKISQGYEFYYKSSEYLSYREKSLGNYNEYLKFLEKNKSTKLNPDEVLNKIEILFILNRKNEAIEYAKKIYDKGKFMKSDFKYEYRQIIENIATGNCQ